MGTAQTTFAGERWGATGSHVTGSDISHMTGSHQTWPEVCSAHARLFPAFFSYYCSRKCNTVVQVPGLPEVTKGHVIPFGVPLCVRMRNRKLCNIHSSGAFWPEVTLWNVTPSWAKGVEGVCALGCSLWSLRLSWSTETSPFTGYLSLSHHFISMGAPSIEGHSAFIQACDYSI